MSELPPGFDPSNSFINNFYNDLVHGLEEKRRKKYGEDTETATTFTDHWFNLGNNTWWGAYNTSRNDKINNEDAVRLQSEITGSAIGTTAGTVAWGIPIIGPIIGAFILIYTAFPDKVLNSAIEEMDILTGGLSKIVRAQVGLALSDTKMKYKGESGKGAVADTLEHQKSLSDKLVSGVDNALKKKNSRKVLLDSADLAVSITNLASGIFANRSGIAFTLSKVNPEGMKALEKFREGLSRDKPEFSASELRNFLPTDFKEKYKKDIENAGSFFEKNGDALAYLQKTLLPVINDVYAKARRFYPREIFQDIKIESTSSLDPSPAPSQIQPSASPADSDSPALTPPQISSNPSSSQQTWSDRIKKENTGNGIRQQ
ncbi:MAG: hypothetical protein LBH46_01915 [Rickettsiales bacterium]|nr:hypothetical protein [Rickettsiales bacterium]